MSDISVALTTTGFLKESDGGEVFETNLWRSNIPVCVAAIGMGLFGYGPEVEKMEHIMAQSCKENMGKVYVESDKKYIFIGENPADESTGMILYTVDKDSDYTKMFFSRWEQTHQLIHQFCIYGFDRKPRFSVLGYWMFDHWNFLEIVPSERFHIAIPERPLIFLKSIS